MSSLSQRVIRLQSLLHRVLSKGFLIATPLAVPFIFLANVFASIFSPSEIRTVFSAQSLLIWDKPYFSAVFFIVVHCLFWLIVYLNKRFFFYVSIFGMALFAYKFMASQILPELRALEGDDDHRGSSHTYPEIFSELSRYISCLHNYIRTVAIEAVNLRQRNHGLFCFIGCVCFAVLAVIGHVVPGVLILYSLILAVTLGPGILLHLVPPTIYDQLVGFFLDTGTNEHPVAGSRLASDSDSELDEFLPDPSADIVRELSLKEESMDSYMPEIIESKELEALEEEQIETLRELGMDSFISEGEEASLYKGLCGFPSVEEEDESDLENELPEKIDDAAAEKNENGIHFAAEHFKESSDSESDVFTEGLTFAPIAEGKEPTEKDSTAPAESKTDNLTAEGAGAVAASTAKVSVSSEADLDLTDFEILEESDLML